MSERKVNLKFRWEIITALFLLVILPNVVVADIIPEKAPGDESETRRFVMDNGLKVLLVSDPKFNVSAASMSVAIGSLSDSESAMGSTHFLEHMLFLGTEKYPAVDDYSKYLNSNGGWSNAYTARDHTNYYFEVKHDALGGALERFSQFFIAPLFDTKYTERERNAVDSEHGKNLLNDGWRVRQLRRSYYNSPFNKFSTGSHETLEHVSVGQLKEFYSKHYGATQMALVILGKESLDALENYTKEYFGPIENRGLEDIQFDQTYLQRKEALRMLKVLPVKDVKYIEFEFPLQPLIGHYKSKIGSLIGTALGDEGEGSLLAHLKEEGLATGLSAGSSDRTKNNSSFGITV
ncbi:MAG: insulinase family protein, partial [Candidatus Lindowbacteria bacterium]|nr:insulinase family protein [Candidatus Lindowbacteria bacterium]